MTVVSVIAAQPSWLAGSAAAQDLWMATGAYAEQHGHLDKAGEAFGKAAQDDGPQSSLASAAAGPALLFSDRQAARQHLQRARDQGQILLADIGLSMLEIPQGDGRPAPIPQSVTSASSEELDAVPNVLSFLAEMAVAAR